MPTTLTGLLLLVVILLPGITYVAIRERNTPEQRRSAFRETATVATISILANIVALGIFALVRILLPNMTPDIGEMVDDTESYVRESYASVTLWSLAVFALAVVLAALAANTVGGNAGHPSTMSAWWMLFRRYNPEKFRHVGCFLDDGSWVEGRLASFNKSADDTPDRELILVEPIKFAFARKDRATPYPANAVCISARRIVTMFVSYMPSAVEQGPSPPTERSFPEASASPEAQPKSERQETTH